MTWRERIAAARERGRFTQDEIARAGARWETCAVGEQHAMYPTVVVMEESVLWPGTIITTGPADHRLFRLGDTISGFGDAVARNDFNKADVLLDAIEDRVLQLKREHVG
jgi:hypothetical protein